MSNKKKIYIGLAILFILLFSKKVSAEKLIAKIDEIAEIFWATKK